MAWNDPDKLRARFSFVCDMPLSEMAPQADGVRRCGRCEKNVYPAESPEAFDALARTGACVYAVNTSQSVLVAAPPPPPLKGTPSQPRMTATAGIPYEPDRVPQSTPPQTTTATPRKKPSVLPLMLGGLMLGIVGSGLLLAIGAVVIGWLTGGA